ncbi:MAG: helix-turn-helix domain-containing protein, partial [Sciscionella sp.]
MADVVRDPGLPQGPLVQSLVRGFAVLRCFDAATPRLTLSQIAEIAGLDRAAARRYLHTFAAMGYVGIEGRMFHLRPRILELGYSYLSSLSLPQVAAPFLSSLAEELAESCALTVLDGAELVYLATANTPRALAIRLTVGNRLPAYCTAMGRV